MKKTIILKIREYLIILCVVFCIWYWVSQLLIKFDLMQPESQKLDNKRNDLLQEISDTLSRMEWQTVDVNVTTK